jgi:hypothetical protein
VETELRVGRALQLLERLTSEMCAGKVETEAEVGDRSVLVRFVASSAADSKVLAGHGGAHIKALITVAILLFKGTHLRVEIDRIECEGEVEMALDDFVPRKDWPKDKVVSLLKDCAAACFGECAVSERSANGSGEKSVLRVTLARAGKSEVRFARAMATLFRPIGVKNGRKLAVLLRSQSKGAA